jgi:hypothetical protein
VATTRRPYVESASVAPRPLETSTTNGGRRGLMRQPQAKALAAVRVPTTTDTGNAELLGGVACCSMSWSPFSRPRFPHELHRWFDQVAADVAVEYNRLHAEAAADPQRSGHGGESTWLRLLADWLPPAYGVGARKYIVVPETDEQPFETDIVVFNPGYPERLREREEVLAAGVAAAFSVKLRLDAAGLRDAVDRAARLRRGVAFRFGSVRQELNPPFVAGLLAHSHSWRRAEGVVVGHVQRGFSNLDKEYARHPRECLDLLCVSDLASWSTTRGAFAPGAGGGCRRTKWREGFAERGCSARFRTPHVTGYCAPHLSGSWSPIFLLACHTRTQRFDDWLKVSILSGRWIS